MSSADHTPRVLRTRTSTGNTVDSPDEAETSSPPASSTTRRKSRNTRRPEDMEYISNTAGYLFYEDLVKTLYAKPQGSGFRNPVLDQWTEDAVPGYLDIIKTPMDLGTIKDRLKEGHYNRLISGNPYLDEEGVKRDIRLVFENCMEYNEPDSSFYNDAENLLKIAEQEFGKRDEDLEKEKIADEEERAERNRERAEARKARKREKDRERHAKRYAALKPERDAQRRLKEEMKAKQRAEDERLRET